MWIDGKSLIDSIAVQYLVNHEKNIFLDSELVFAKRTVELLQHHRDSVIELLSRGREQIAAYLSDSTQKKICELNQYANFSAVDSEKLYQVYLQLTLDMENREMDAESIAKRHYERLRFFLLQTNPFLKTLNGDGKKAVSALCAEYSFSLQKQILGLDGISFQQPLLDIGCGKSGFLVKEILKEGIEAYGIDRFCPPSKHFFEGNWLEYDYGIGKWGTIVSNMAFTVHFLHQHKRTEGLFAEYGKTYMAVLNSLKAGGNFHYAPSVPFIEDLLSKEQFCVDKRIAVPPFETVIITKL